MHVKIHLFMTSVSVLMDEGYPLGFLSRNPVVCVCLFIKVHIHMYVDFFIYLFISPTEPTVGPRCVARKQCPMATAEAHASTRTFL